MESGHTSSVETAGPRRTALLQDRSRATRRRLVRVALELWSERGFETGVEDTTVDEIVRAAGVTKGTFYFHFAHKEDILLELGWGTGEVLYAEALRGAEAGTPGLALLRRLLTSLAKRAESVPRAAVERAVSGFYAHGLPLQRERRGIDDAFAIALDAAKAQGELPDDTNAEEAAKVITAISMDTLYSWSASTRRPRRLRPVLLRRASVVIDGMRPAVPAISGDSTGN